MHESSEEHFLLITSLYFIQIQTVMIRTLKANYSNEGIALTIIKDTLHMLAASYGISRSASLS